jgi:hypothetical protein
MSINQGKAYHVSAYIGHIKREDRGSLVDRGANGGIIGGDAWITHEHLHRVDVTGIDNHEMSQIKVVDAAAKVVMQKGPVIIIMNQYAFYGRGRTIHSLGQIKAYKNWSMTDQ